MREFPIFRDCSSLLQEASKVEYYETILREIVPTFSKRAETGNSSRYLIREEQENITAC